MNRKWLRTSTIAVLAALSTLSATGCSYFSYPSNPLLEKGGARLPYRFSAVIPPETAAPADETLIVLTLSGGGTRAAALSYGVMRELDRAKIGGGTTSLMDEVDVISSVSGGSFASAYYGLFGKREFFSDFRKDVLDRSIQTDLLLAALAPWHWPRLMSPYFGRSDLAAEYYDDEIFRGSTFANMPRQRPFVVLNATDMTLGAQFTFTQDDFDKICSDLAPVKVARAVTASSAFPGGFTPLTVDNYPKKDCGYQSPGWFKPASADLDNLPSRYDRFATGQEYESDERRYLHLFDGGLADNIGLRGAILALSSTDSPWKLREKIDAGHIKRIVVIIVDAKPKAEPEQDASARPPGLTSVVVASGTNPMENYSADSIDLLESRFYEERRLQSIWETDRKRCAEFAAQQCTKRRDRDGCTSRVQNECARTFGVTNDDRVHYPELYRIYIRFAAADEPARDQLNAMPTSLQLKPEDVDLLVAQGAALLHKPKAFKRLEQDLRIEWKD